MTQSITDDRLLKFLKKVDELRANQRRNTGHMTMPNFYKQDTNVARMPKKDLRFLDSATGLQYSTEGKIYDPKLDIGLDVATGTVYDFQHKKLWYREEIEKVKERYRK